MSGQTWQSPVSNPEILRPPLESSDEHEALEELLTGMDDLALACSYSGTDYATEALEAMRRQGIEVNPYTMSQVLQRSFGGPAELLSRMSGCKSEEELEAMLPGEIGDAAIHYLQPVLGEQ